MSTVSSIVKKLDVFSQPVLSFNIRGQALVRTWPGAIASILVLFLVMIYSFLKLEYLIERRNALITTNGTPLLPTDSYSLQSDEF